MNKKYLPLWILVIIGFVACNQPQSAGHAATGENAGKVAYVNTDTLMENYQFAKDLNEEFTKKQENMTADLNVKAKKVEDMIKSFQYRLQNNGFATRKRAEQEQRHIEKKRQELIELDQTLKNELAEDYQNLVNRLQDTIIKALEFFNETAGYDLILRTTKGGNVLLGNSKFDITEAFVKQLNDAYVSKDLTVKSKNEKQESSASDRKKDTTKK